MRVILAMDAFTGCLVGGYNEIEYLSRHSSEMLFRFKTCKFWNFSGVRLSFLAATFTH